MASNHRNTYDLYVVNIHPDVTEAAMKEVFPASVSMSIMDGRQQHDTGKIGFVRFALMEDAIAAMDAAKGVSFHGRFINVRPASKAGKTWFTGKRNDIDQKHPGTVTPNKGNVSGSRQTPIRTETVIFGHNDSPIDFWAQSLERVKELEDLSEQLQMIGPGGNTVNGRPSQDKVYATVYSEDKLWYRCRAIQHMNEAESEVLFIDYGNKEVKENSEIREIMPSMANVKAHATKYTLHNLRKCHEQNTIGFTHGCTKLMNILGQAPFKVDIYPSNEPGGVPVVARTKSIDVNDAIVQDGFAVVCIKNLKTVQSSKQLHQPHHQQQSFLHPPPGIRPLITQWNPQADNMVWDKERVGCLKSNNNEVPVPVGEWVSGDNGSTKATITDIEAQYLRQQVLQGQHQVEKLRNKLKQIQENADNEKGTILKERDQIRSERDQTLTALSVSEKERELAKSNLSKLHEDYLLLTQLQKERSFSSRLSKLVQSVNKVRKSRPVHPQWCMPTTHTHSGRAPVFNPVLQPFPLGLFPSGFAQTSPGNVQVLSYIDKVEEGRKGEDVGPTDPLGRVQFPTQESCEDKIEKSFGVVMDPAALCLNDMEQFHSVEKALNAYKAAQNCLHAAEKLEDLGDSIAERDEARRKLHHELSYFVEHVETLSLDSRAIVLEECSRNLQKTYQRFYLESIPSRSDIISFAEAKSLYLDWKAQKLSLFHEARTRTNTCHNEVDSALDSLMQLLALNEEDPVERSCLNSGLEHSIDQFQEAVVDEDLKTDIIANVNEPDTSLIATVLKLLESEIRFELNDINRIRRLFGEYTSMRDSLSTWLDSKPDLSPLVDVRKDIKAFKSKLRHKLADLQDAVESEDDLGEEVQTLKEDLRALRASLHEKFIQEDEMLVHFAEIKENYFPELYLEYPDMGIDFALENHHLLKKGRALSHYELECMSTSKRNVHKTKFAGKDVVLKEYMIGEQYGIRLTDFLRRAFFYQKIINPHVLRVQSIFSVEDGRPTYVQLPYHPDNLATLVEKQGVTPEMCYKILKGVLMGLQAIHAANLVVGAIHPNNVLISDENEAIISEIDFSKTPHQRVGSYVASNGIQFQAPESQKLEVSWATDMFNLGLLTLWMHFPTYPFVTKGNGVPDFSPLVMENGLEDVVMGLLQAEPASRRTANSMWHLPYFSKSPYSRPASPVQKATVDPEKETLQLTPKSRVSPVRSPGGGILKNACTKSYQPTINLQLTSPPSHEPELESPPALEDVQDVTENGPPALEVVDGTENGLPGLEVVDGTDNGLPGLEVVDGTDNGLPGLEVVDGTENGLPALEVVGETENIPPGVDIIDRTDNAATNGPETSICARLDTPSNTPVEGESGSSSPNIHDNNNTTGLVKDAMNKASQLIENSRHNDSIEEEEEEEILDTTD